MISDERIKEIEDLAREDFNSLKKKFGIQAKHPMHILDLLDERKQLVKIADHSHAIKVQYDLAWKEGKAKKAGLFALMSVLGSYLKEWKGNDETDN